MGFGTGRNRDSQLVHAALHEPHARLLDMCDEHQGRGGVEGRGPAISRVATEKLTDTWIVEVSAKRTPECHKR